MNTPAPTKPIKPKKFKGELADGLWSGVSMEVYHAHPAISSTALRVLLRSPLTFRRMIDGELENEPTDAMEFGTCQHAALFERRFDFHIQPETYGPENKPWSGNSGECKKWLAEHSDKPVLSASQARKLSEAVGYIRAHPKGQRYIRGGHAEVSVIAGGMKARPDYLIIHPDNTCTIVDLKTTTDASRVAFGRECLNREYHIQFAWYKDTLAAIGLTVVSVKVLALQKGKLPLLNVLEFSPAALRLGQQKCMEALALLAQCEANDYWPEWAEDDPKEVKLLELPEYAFAGQETELEIGGERVTV